MKHISAQEIMTEELITLKETDTVEEALKALINNKITGLPVVDSTGKLVGVLSEYDLLRQISKHAESAQSFLEVIEFSRNPFSLPVTTPVADVIKHFLDSKYRRVPILDQDQRLVGIITRRDLMRMYFYRAKLQ